MFYIFACLTSGIYSQILFTYGNNAVTKEEFLRAYNKNKTAVSDKAMALREYLDLYIKFKLKVKAAKDMRIDTLSSIANDLQNFRSQIEESYLNDESSVNALIDEAFYRSQKDIHAAYLFFPLKDYPDSVSVERAAKSQTSAWTDVGFITVFNLPYEFENIMYSLKPGEESKPYSAKNGYYIFKNLGERKALGRIKASQILLAFPPDITEAQKKPLKKLADSLYNRLLKGSNFADLATQFSNDYISSQANGIIPEFGVGQYEPVFENTILSLKDGAISKPFETSYGFHIVKRMSVAPPASSKTDPKVRQAMTEIIEQNDRIEITKEALAQKILKEAKYQRLPFDDKQLWAFSDSLFTSQKPAIAIQLNSETPLLKLGDETTKVSQWINYAQQARYKEDGSGFKPYHQVWNGFVKATALDYYRNHLEDFNASFRNQMNEFKEGNLFFEIMQKEIWGPAQSDTVALEAYYQKNKNKYTWGKSADAVIFYTSDLPVAQLVSAQIKKNPASWQNLVTTMSDKVSADSGRFELNQIPNAGNIVLKNGAVTSPVLSKTDNTASFAYIRNIYSQPAPRSFEEAKGLVINDYQAELEKKWIDELKKKYPVTINQIALSSLMTTARK